MSLGNSVAAIAFALVNGPKQYALLLGSGVSTGAGIPTGWGVALDLARRIPSAPIGDETAVAAWFERTFGRPLDYTSVMEALGKAPADRLNLLQPYFEPTPDERDRSVKVPSPAHRAIAELIRLGLVRVVITTNFDRLLEQALREIGIEPTVIHHSDMIRGALPYAYQKCLIIKVHGDYLDTRLLNTNEELADYPSEMKEYLARLLGDHGLIVSGWSADYDPALAALVTSSASSPFSTFWLQKGGMSPAAMSVSGARRAEIVKVESADQAFEELLAAARSVSFSTAPAGLDSTALMARCKRLLQDGKSIELHDMVLAETERALTSLESDSFDPNLNPGGNEQWFVEFKRRVSAYEDAVNSLSAILMVIAYYGSPEHQVVVRQALERLGLHPTSTREGRAWGGVHMWLSLMRYPSVLVFWRIAAAAVAAEKWSNLRPLLIEAQVPLRPYEASRVPMIAEMAPYKPFDEKEQALWLVRKSYTDQTARYTPDDDYVAERVVDALAAFGVSRQDGERTFDVTFFLAQLAYLDVPEEVRFFQTFLSYGRWWRILQSYRGWPNSPQARLVASIAAQGDSSPVLKSGVAGGSAAAFASRAEEARKILETARR